jgi:D-serine dehydratase
VLVDSPRAVELLGAGLAAAGSTRQLPVLLEVGAAGGRAGARDDTQARAVAAAVAASGQLVLAGVEAWEGGLGSDRCPATLAAIDALVARALALAVELDAAGAFTDRAEILLTAGGSAYFDRVAAGLRPDRPLSRPARTVLRSGCYLTHDHGGYERLSPLAGRLRPALQLWTDVRSRPEPGLAIVGFGKRDAPYDSGLPVVLGVVEPDGTRRPPPPGAHVAATNDQHAFVRWTDGELAVGDVLVCGISHPCTAFDKWSALPLVDETSSVVGAVRTVF